MFPLVPHLILIAIVGGGVTSSDQTNLIKEQPDIITKQADDFNALKAKFDELFRMNEILKVSKKELRVKVEKISNSVKTVDNLNNYYRRPTDKKV